MVAGMYEKTTARVVVGEGVSEEFEVNIGLRQGSVQSRSGSEDGCGHVREDNSKSGGGRRSIRGV